MLNKSYRLLWSVLLIKRILRLQNERLPIKFIGYETIHLKLNQYFWKPCLTIIEQSWYNFLLIIIKFNHESGDRVGLKQVLQGKEFGSGGFKILFYSKESLKFGDIFSKIIKYTFL